MTKLLQRLRFDLADTLAGHAERLADLFERVVGHSDPKPHPQNALLAGCELGQDLCHAVSKRGSLCRGMRINGVRRLYEIGQGGVAILADWDIERSGVLHQR